MSAMPPNTASIWNEALQVQRDRLLPKKYVGVLGELSFEAFEQSLSRLREDHNKNTIVRCIDRLKPVFERLNYFTAAITNTVQAHANPAALIWGALQALLVCACDFAQTFEDVTDMLEKMSDTVVRVNRYLELLQTNEKLQELSRRLVSDYVGFCIDALILYKERKYYTLIKTFRRNIQGKFKRTQARIDGNITRFEKEARVEIDEVLINGQRNIQERLPLKNSVPQIPVQGIITGLPSQNDFFFGREETLKDLHKQLAPSSEHSRRSCLVHGMAGMGKTQVVVEYIYRFQKYYRCIFWLGSQRGPELATNFIKNGGKLGIPEYEDMGGPRKIEVVKDFLEKTEENWLLVFDNVEYWETIVPYLPSCQHGSIVVTSQDPGLKQLTISELPLQPFSDNDGAELLLRRQLRQPRQPTSAGDFTVAQNISNVVGGLPIAIAHIAGTMVESQLVLTEVLEKFERQRAHEIWTRNAPLSTLMYKESLFMVWNFALEELSNESLRFLRVLSMLHPDTIPEAMLLDHNPKNLAIADRKEELEKMRTNLTKRHLVQRNMEGHGANLSVHRSLQLNLRVLMKDDPEIRQDAFNTAFAIARIACPRHNSVMAPVNEEWSKYEKSQPHILSLQSVYTESDSGLSVTPEYAALLFDASNFVWEQGFFHAGIESLRVAQSICQSAEDNCWMQLGDIHDLLGVVLVEPGISGRENGLKHLLESLNLRKKKIETPPPGGDKTEQMLFANSWNDFGCIMLEYENYEEAERYLEHSLAIKKRLETEETEPFEFAETYRNLAIVWLSQGRHSEAIEQIERAALLIEGDKGEHCATTQNFRFHWANLLFIAGEVDASLAKHQEVLQARKNIFGNYGFRTRHSYYALGVVYEAKNDYEEAVHMIRESLVNPEDAQWSEECFARAKFRLARLFRQQHRPKRADELEKEACITRDKLFPDHAQFLKGGVVDQMLIFDHMVSNEAGRSMIGRAKVKSVDKRIQETDIGSSILQWKRLDGPQSAMPASSCTSSPTSSRESSLEPSPTPAWVSKAYNAQKDTRKQPWKTGQSNNVDPSPHVRDGQDDLMPKGMRMMATA
ncbi:MAG: hypothetical protein M1812_000666 [Candelaria pacifica]|nr:MAG: hypothetical protein M1812_000666 [Candelaria pacifica]